MLKYMVVAAALAGFAAACSDDDKFGPSIISTEPEPMTEVDYWIRDNYGKYNIDILYKWNDFETDQEYDLVPPQENVVVPCLEIIQRVWMNPYLTLGGERFFKTTSPKQVMLLGSRVFVDDNVIIGEAQQGNRITLYGLNGLNPKDAETVRAWTQAFHHEYVHILHQTVKYPRTYEELSSGKYTINWQGIPELTAQDQGFITPYAMADPNEDFAEMVSNFIRVDESRWNNYFAALQSRNAEGYRILRQKETLALQYMKNVWGIDLYELRDLVQREVALIEEENNAQPQP
jgi:substrate import-associated zinc metallohydrolase lipoprotein